MLVNEIAEGVWIRAAKRAEEQSLAAVVIDQHCDRKGRVDVWVDVDSSSSNIPYRVRITTDADGVQVECGCKAGCHEVCCKHVAAALEVTGMWWAVVPLQPEPPVKPSDREIQRLIVEMMRASRRGEYAREDALSLRIAMLRGERLA